MSLMSFSFKEMQLTGITVAPYFSVSSAHIVLADSLSGLVQFMITTNGLFMLLSSLMTLSSHSSYSSLGISEMLPSVVTTSPIVECSEITF